MQFYSSLGLLSLVQYAFDLFFFIVSILYFVRLYIFHKLGAVPFLENDANVRMATDIPASSILLLHLEPLNLRQFEGVEMLLALASVRPSQNKQAC